MGHETQHPIEGWFPVHDGLALFGRCLLQRQRGQFRNHERFWRGWHERDHVPCRGRWQLGNDF
jgi:hypothetical protein